jgi:hypothetical protein
MRIVSRIFCGLILLCTLAVSYPLLAADDVPMKAMKDEMARSMTMQLTGLGKPYFVAYRIQDITDITIAADLGSVVSSQNNRSRLLHVELRVGDYKLDNTNFLSIGSRQASGFGGGQQMAIDDDYNEIRREIWLSTDSEYKKAVELFTSKQAALQNQSHGEDLPDFTQEKPNKYFAKQSSVTVNVADVEATARQISAIFRQLGEPQRSQVTIEHPSRRRPTPRRHRASISEIAIRLVGSRSDGARAADGRAAAEAAYRQVFRPLQRSGAV